jgi:hypothetical protein
MDQLVQRLAVDSPEDPDQVKEEQDLRTAGGHSAVQDPGYVVLQPKSRAL